MKAVLLRRFGGPDVLETVDLPRPTPGPGEVRIRVRAAGVNFAETLMRENRYALTPPLPAVLGSEVAGEVEAVGAGVDLALGTRVIAPLFAAGLFFGGYAEEVVAPAEWLVPIPDAVDFDTATALTVQGTTAALLLERAPVAGKSVLVDAAAGGVGSLLLQLARRAGASRVIAAAGSPEKRAFALALGADAAIDYGAEDWSEAVRAANGGAGPDVIFDSVGGRVTEDCLALLAPLGRMVIFGALNIQSFGLGVAELTRLIFANQSVTGFAAAPLLTPDRCRAILADLFALVVAGDLTVTIGAVHSLAEAGAAHAALEGRRTIGKIVLRP